MCRSFADPAPPQHSSNKFGSAFGLIAAVAVPHSDDRMGGVRRESNGVDGDFSNLFVTSLRNRGIVSVRMGMCSGKIDFCRFCTLFYKKSVK